MINRERVEREYTLTLSERRALLPPVPLASNREGLHLASAHGESSLPRRTFALPRREH